MSRRGQLWKVTTNSIPEKGRAKKDKKKERQQPTKHTNKKKNLVYRKKVCSNTHKKRSVGEHLYYWNSIYFAFKIKIVVKLYGRFPLFPSSERALSVALSTSTLLWTLPMSRTFSSRQAHNTHESIPLILSISPISCCCHSAFCFHKFDHSEEVEPLRLFFWIWFVSFSMMFCRFIGVVCYTSPQINTMPASPSVSISQYWHYRHVLPHPAINVGALDMNLGP